MDKKNAWKVEFDLIDRFLDMLADNGFRWMTGRKANNFKDWDDGDTIIFVEETPKIITYEGYSFYLKDPHEEFNLIEVTEEWLRDREKGEVTSIIVSNGPVNRSTHDNHGGLETIKIIEAFLTKEEYRGFLKGSILKYQEWMSSKGNVEQDCKKVKWYLDELIRLG